LEEFSLQEFKEFSLQELSSRIGKETEFETLQLKGEIAENVVHPKNPPLDTVHA
jgi:hypothetical protein